MQGRRNFVKGLGAGAARLIFDQISLWRLLNKRKQLLNLIKHQSAKAQTAG